MSNSTTCNKCGEIFDLVPGRYAMTNTVISTQMFSRSKPKLSGMNC